MTVRISWQHLDLLQHLDYRIAGLWFLVWVFNGNHLDREPASPYPKKAPNPRGRSGALSEQLALDVVIQLELVRVGPQANRVDLALPLVGEPRFDQVRGEDVAFREEVVIVFECQQCTF